MFVFTVQHVTLKQGERMVLPIAEFTLPYKDVFTLELPFAPPPEVRGNLNNEQQRELARLFNAPKVMHKVRLTNKSKYPLTTAPALIVRGRPGAGAGDDDLHLHRRERRSAHHHRRRFPGQEERRGNQAHAECG